MDENNKNNEKYEVNFIIHDQEQDKHKDDNKSQPVSEQNLLLPLLPSVVPPPKVMAAPRAKRPRLSFVMLAFLVLVGGFGIGAGLGAGYLAVAILTGDHPGDSISLVDNNSMENMVFAPDGPLTMVDAVERVKPAVVSINTTNVQTYRFFSSPTFEREMPGSGTGIVFHQDDERVFIVTNEHVIDNATQFTVTFGRQRPVEAHPLGRDRRSDLAVIYVNKTDLARIGITDITVAEFGDSDQMQIGEFVVAIGNALGQGITTTMGIVSAQNIQISLDNRVLSVMQTDAAINPGNSGGPLINSAGQVIGINTVKLAREHVYGMGYSITSNVALPIMDTLMNQTGQPLLGIRGQDISGLSEETKYHLGVGNLDHGIIIAIVSRNSGAYRAGLVAYDIITTFDGQNVINMDHLRELIALRQIGDTIELLVIREGEEIRVDTTFVSF